MNRLWIELVWPCLWRGLLPSSAPLWVPVVVECPPLATWGLAGTAVSFLAVFLWRTGFVWRLAWRVRRYRRAAAGRVVLYRPPEFDEFEFARDLLDRCQKEVHVLAGQFGFTLRRRVVVYCLANVQQVTELYGRDAGGFAMPRLSGIVVGRSEHVSEFLRHELAHLFAAKWGTDVPAFLNEGLAVWSQGTWHGQPVDEHACMFVGDPSWSLSRLLNRAFIFDARNRETCYVLAGSFTAFLIREFGWDRYRRVFRAARRRGVRRAVQANLGRNLEDLEREWKSKLRDRHWPTLP